MLEAWPERRRETLASFKIFDVLKVRRGSPRTRKDVDFLVLDTRDWVNCLALTGEGGIVMVRQFRQGSTDFTLEMPGGVVHEGEGMVEAALRELREESGFRAADARLIGEVNPNPAIFTNRCGTVLATGCERAGDPEPDPGEDFEVCLLDPRAFKEALRKGEVDHALVLAALVWLELDRAGVEGAFPSLGVG